MTNLRLGQTTNSAIFQEEAPQRILAAARDTLDWGIAWCCGIEGMHPHDLIRLRPKNLDGQGFLRWFRAKNRQPRSAMVPEADRPRMAVLLQLLAKSPPTTKTVWMRARSLTARAGYQGGPRVLRKTAILNDLRRQKGRSDQMDLVAARAGCKRETVIMYYLELQQWEEAGR